MSVRSSELPCEPLNSIVYEQSVLCSMVHKGSIREPWAFTRDRHDGDAQCSSGGMSVCRWTKIHYKKSKISKIYSMALLAHSGEQALQIRYP